MNARFVENVAEQGAGLAWVSGVATSEGTCSGCGFVDNDASVNGGGVHVASGTLRLMGSSGVLQGNVAPQGAAVHVTSGGKAHLTSQSVTHHDVPFPAANCGALRVEGDGQLFVTGGTVADNADFGASVAGNGLLEISGGTWQSNAGDIVAVGPSSPALYPWMDCAPQVYRCYIGACACGTP